MFFFKPISRNQITKKPFSEILNYESRLINCRDGDVWQIGGSFVRIATNGNGVVLQVIRDMRDVVKLRKDVEITDNDFNDLTSR